jgi:hypothetical protein
MSSATVTAYYGTSLTSDAGQTSQGPSNLIDGSSTTKFRSLSTTGPWILYIDLGSAQTFYFYYLTTANDAADGDPVTWYFEGSNDTINWDVLNYQFNYPVTTNRQYDVGFTNSIGGGIGGIYALGYSRSGKNGFPTGFALDNGSSFYLGYGLNYSGGGGAGGDIVTDKGGSTLGNGYAGGPLGGGGGGGVTGGAGAQGGVIISWTYQSVLPSTSQQISMSEIADALNSSSSGISLGSSTIRTAFGVSSGAIAFSNGANKYRIPSVVTYINTTSIPVTSISLLSGASNYGGWQADDLAIAFVQEINGVPNEQNNLADWTYVGYVYNTYTGTYLSVFYRVLVQGDSSFAFTSINGGCQILILRGATKVSLRSTILANSATVSFSGITKSSNSKALLSFLCHRNRPDADMTVPSGWSEASAADWVYFYAKSALISALSYTNATTISWTLVNTGYYSNGLLLELT